MKRRCNPPAIPANRGGADVGDSAAAGTVIAAGSLASSNDFAGVYARQVQALGRAGDVLIGISTGRSAANVIAAVHQARGLGMRTIALTA